MIEFFPQLRQTYFADNNLKENYFLARSITALLMSQAHCVVVGNDRPALFKVGSPSLASICWVRPALVLFIRALMFSTIFNAQLYDC